MGQVYYQCDLMYYYKVAKLPPKGCLKRPKQFSLQNCDVFKVAKKSLDILATFTRKWITKNFQKSSNLVTLYITYVGETEKRMTYGGLMSISKLSLSPPPRLPST